MNLKPTAPITARLLAMLATRNDDGTPPLRVSATVTVTRDDGSEPSELEQRHIRGVMAAHAAEPIK